MSDQNSQKMSQKSEQDPILETKTISSYLSQKAGMSQIDKKAIQAKIQAITKGTPKDLYDREMQAKRDQQIKKMIKQIPQYTSQQRADMKNTWDKKIKQYEKYRDLTKYWAHLDFDMFYAACELLDKPHLRDKPCGVGSLGGILATANYQARKYGIRSSMPTFIAIKLCPDLVLLPTDFQKYKKYSKIFRDILSQFDPNLQSYGLDQAYVQITDFVKDLTYEQIDDFIRKVRTRIFQATQLTVSCGVGANKMLAKMASQEKKPNDQFILRNDAEQIRNYMRTKPLRKIPGIGTVNQYFFRGLNIQNVQQLLQNTDVLQISFAQNTVKFYVEAAIGLGSNKHEPLLVRKSVSQSQSFKATSDKYYLQNKLKQLCSGVSYQLKHLGLVTINVVFLVQYANFVRKDRNFNLIKYTSEQQELFNYCIKELRSVNQQVRNIGVRCSSIIYEQQLEKMSLQNFMKSKKQKRQASQHQHQAKQKQKSQIQKAKQLMTQSVGQEKGKMLCPICCQLIDCKGNIIKFNRHLDKCLKQQSDRQQTKSQPDLGKRFNQKQKLKNGRKKQSKLQSNSMSNFFINKQSKRSK